MSRSEAMSVKLLVTSLWQNRFWILNAAGRATASLGLCLGCSGGVERSSVALVVEIEKRLAAAAVRQDVGTDRTGLGRSLVQRCGRELSLETCIRDASFKEGRSERSECGGAGGEEMMLHVTARSGRWCFARRGSRSVHRMSMFVYSNGFGYGRMIPQSPRLPRLLHLTTCLHL